MKWQGFISSKPEVYLGKACITGTRVMATVILDERELHRAREYIAGNPLKWDMDWENPDVALNRPQS